jgi:prophage regulatory protein
MSEKRLIDLAEVTRLTGLKRTAIYERMARKDFPQAVKLGTASRWVDAEIQAWIDRQIEHRDKIAA